jgi:glycogen operon protein
MKRPGHGISAGSASPLGATARTGGVNFSVYSRASTGMEILLFDRVDGKPVDVIRLDPTTNRTFHYWHALVPGIGPGQIYAFRARGPFAPDRGLRFDPDKALLDPYGRAVVVPDAYSRAACAAPGDTAEVAMKSVVAERRGYDWEGDSPLRRPFASTVIYEMHVGAFTRHPSSGVAPSRRGTYAGLIEKIPYLVDLGVTAIELLPVFQFDAQDAPGDLVNSWGYSPVAFFAPHAAYSSRTDPLGPIHEFRDMVKALHRAGLEIVLDVVYNHTAESDERGPTLCFKGLANAAYYILETDRARYANYTGTGNTLNANRSIVRRLILDSLRYWVQDMHVDGFRFDLASILARDEAGRPEENPPILWDIETDPVLAGTKLIAEAWDAAGMYQVGVFPGDRWKEWNGKFRDDVRAFVRGEPGTVSRVASRILASPDLYERAEPEDEQEAAQSINFVTCHDGFTLNDLVSYDRKHNEANGEDNRDGTDDNRSWNCGVEGETTDPAIERLRNQQVKNVLAITLLALGTPMLLMGDEVRRTQRGNNNAYCHDGELTWLDWSARDRHADIHRFAQQLIAFRRSLDLARADLGLTLRELLRRAAITWHGVRLDAPDWSHDAHTLAFSIDRIRGDDDLYCVISAYWEPLVFELPRPRPGRAWRRILDTSLDAPDDLRPPHEAPELRAVSCRVAPRSMVLLLTG